MAPRFIPFKTRFDQKWRLDADSGCWIWEGALHLQGYGKMYRGGRVIPAHRLGWEIYKGPIAKGVVLDHLCRRKNCVNPDHLDPVSVAENSKRRNYEFWRGLDEKPHLRSPRAAKPTFRERFNARWKLNEGNGCWEWTGPLTGGYGRISVGGHPEVASRVAYELHVGKIPAGLHIDHLCRNRSCVNPFHLEPVTNAENGRRGNAAHVNRILRLALTRCKRGHPFSGSNLIIDKASGQRICRACRIIRKRKYRGRPLAP